MYEFNLFNESTRYRITSKIFVNDSLFSFYQTFNSDAKQLYKFQLLVSRRVQRYLISIQSNIIIQMRYDIGLVPVLSPMYDIEQSLYTYYPVVYRENERIHFLEFNFRNDMPKNIIAMELQTRANEIVIKAFNDAIEFILSLKANTIPVMRTISELATFRGLPPNPEAEESNKRIRGEPLTNEERLDALQLVAQNQSEFTKLNVNDLPIDMLRKLRQ